jgi:hypothetical protein
MSRPLSPIVCDRCGKQKQESNHWWTIEVFHDSERPDIRLTAGTISAPALPAKCFDACGHECALKIVSEQMGKVTS